MTSEVLDTVRGVGWVTQVQQADGTWLSWTQFKEPGPAEKLGARLLEQERYGFVAARVQRVDWTVVRQITPATDPAPEEAPQERA